MIDNFNETKCLIDFIEKKQYKIKQIYINKVFEYVEKYYTFFKSNNRGFKQVKRNVLIGKLAELCLRNLIRENGLDCEMVKKKHEEYDKGFDLICNINDAQETIECKSTENSTSRFIYIRDPRWMNFDWLIYNYVDINNMVMNVKFMCDYNTAIFNLVSDKMLDTNYIDITRIT